ncbi:MAG: hypothetical protein IPK21_07650 [Haliscomenobacter sp.]|nr:hypothetical protein [Haliscomenobacter sp.]
MQEYFKINIFANIDPIKDAKYFEEIAALIPKIQPGEWPEIFSVLWNENKPITELYATLIYHLGMLHYAKDVYLPMEAVLRDQGTLLDVDRLKEIYEQYSGTEPDYKPDTSVLYTDNNRKARDFRLAVIPKAVSLCYSCRTRVPVTQRSDCQ